MSTCETSTSRFLTKFDPDQQGFAVNIEEEDEEDEEVEKAAVGMGMEGLGR